MFGQVGLSKQNRSGSALFVILSVPLDKFNIVTTGRILKLRDVINMDIKICIGVSKSPLGSLHKRPNISEIVQIPTLKPYLFLFLMIRHIQWHWLRSPRSMPHLLQFMLNISETVQNCAYEPYILLFLIIRHIQWYWLGVPRVCPTPSVHKRLNISETVQNPIPKLYILLFLMIRHIQWHWPWTPWGYAPPPPMIPTRDPLGVRPTPFHFK